MSVNVNTLPTRGLDRVDILRDGASAVYGSDAVAGVINFVTDKDYEGNELQIQTGATEIGSGNDYGLTWTHGNFALRPAALDLHVRLLQARGAGDARSAERDGFEDKVALAPPGFDSINGPFFDRNASSALPSFRVGMPRDGVITCRPPTAASPSRTPHRRAPVSSSALYYDVNLDGYSVPETRPLQLVQRRRLQHHRQRDGVRRACGCIAPSRRMVRPPVAYGINSDRRSSCRSTILQPVRLALLQPHRCAECRWQRSPHGHAASRSPSSPSASREAGAETIDVETTSIVPWPAHAASSTTTGRGKPPRSTRSPRRTTISQNAIRESALLAATNRTDASAPTTRSVTRSRIANGAVVPDQVYTNPAATIDPFIQKFHQEGKNTLELGRRAGERQAVELPAGPVQLAVGAEHRWDDYEPDAARVRRCQRGWQRTRTRSDEQRLRAGLCGR